jgi:hypothetical protein
MRNIRERDISTSSSDIVYIYHYQGRTDNEIKNNGARECSVDKRKQGNHSQLASLQLQHHHVSPSISSTRNRILVLDICHVVAVVHVYIYIV